VMALTMIVIGCFIAYFTWKYLYLYPTKLIHKYRAKKTFEFSLNDSFLKQMNMAIKDKLTLNSEYLYESIVCGDEALIDYLLCISNGIPNNLLHGYAKLLENRDISRDIKEKICYWLLWGNYWQAQEKVMGTNDYYMAYQSQISKEVVISRKQKGEAEDQVLKYKVIV
jgi:hypothetical protein